jgi:7-cyano-7-deazaguanine synthase
MVTEKRMVVVLSGGLDSTVCLADAVKAGDSVIALSIDYGQRHAVELARARAIAAHYDVEHIEQRLDLSAWGGSALTDASIDVPTATDAADGPAIPITYVPGRNLIFLSLAVALAEARGCQAVSIGVNTLDYSGYPDCRPEFIASFRTTAGLALRAGVEGSPVDVITPLIDLSKADIVRRGVELDAPLQLTWSCYRGDEKPCGDCDSCVLRAKGFAEANVADPALS